LLARGQQPKLASIRKEFSMPRSRFTRRGFAAALGGAFGASLLPSRAAALQFFAATAGDAGGPGGPVRLSANENPYGPCPAALEAMARSAGIASRYPFQHEQEVREAIAKSHAVGPDRVVLGCGSSDVLRMADSAFLASGKRVVAAEPTFEAVLLYARATKAEPVKVPLTPDFRHDLPKMAAACDERVGVVYVCNPNNPTGTIVTGGELEAFVRKVPSSTIVLVDEAYHHFVENPAYRSALELEDRHPNVVVARTFSKIYGMAGMRLGYAVTSEKVAEAMSACASWDNTNQAVLAMAMASLADTGLVARQRALLNGTKHRLCAALAKEKRRYIPSEANFVMIDVSGDVAPVRQAFREKGIQVGRRFPSMPNWLRVSIGKPEEMDAFLAALSEIVPARAAA
jgi:histidinol-phosphate aminotransferase